MLVINAPYAGNVVSNAVSVPIGAPLTLSGVSQSGSTITVNGTGFAPPFIPFSSSGGDPDGALSLIVP